MTMTTRFCSVYTVVVYTVVVKYDDFDNDDDIAMTMTTRFCSVYTVVAVAVERYATLIDFLNKVPHFNQTTKSIFKSSYFSTSIFSASEHVAVLDIYYHHV